MPFQNEMCITINIIIKAERGGMFVHTNYVESFNFEACEIYSPYLSLHYYNRYISTHLASVLLRTSLLLFVYAMTQC